MELGVLITHHKPPLSLCYIKLYNKIALNDSIFTTIWLTDTMQLKNKLLQIQKEIRAKNAKEKTVA